MFSASPEHEGVVFGTHLSVCVCEGGVPEHFVGFYSYSEFKNLPVIT
jgi:hypothetical protein